MAADVFLSFHLICDCCRARVVSCFIITLYIFPGISIFFKYTSTSLFTGGTFYKNANNFHEYLAQHSLKSGGTKDHFRQVKVPGTTPY